MVKVVKNGWKRLKTVKVGVKSKNFEREKVIKKSEKLKIVKHGENIDNNEKQ